MTARVVYKSRLRLGENGLMLQSGARLVHFAVQAGEPTVWYEVRPDETITDQWDLTIVGTDHPIPPGLYHFMTTIDGHYVWHLYVGKLA